MIKQKSEEDIEIISLGEEYGADKFVKKYSIQFGLKYFEFIPRHKRWNSYCIERAFLMGKEYSPKYFFINNSNFVKYCDNFIFFAEKQSELKDNKLIEMIKKSGKNLVLVE